jgi:hypothetical protein
VKNEARTVCRIAVFLLGIFFSIGPARMNAAGNDPKSLPGVKVSPSGHVASTADAHEGGEAKQGTPEQAVAATKTAEKTCSKRGPPR